VITPGAFPGETKMWADVRENGDFLPDIVRQNPAGIFVEN